MPSDPCQDTGIALAGPAPVAALDSVQRASEVVVVDGLVRAASWLQSSLSDEEERRLAQEAEVVENRDN